MAKHTYTLLEDYIELVSLLKVLRIADSGGMAKMLVANEEVKCNGALELRKRYKVRKGDFIEVLDEQIQIV